MTISDEELMAYADGELDDAQFAAQRTRLEAALQADPALERRVAEQRALRARLGKLHAEVLAEPVPERLLAVLAQRPAATVTDLGAHREARASAAPSRRRVATWCAMAASLLVAGGVGYLAYSQRGGNPLQLKNGELVARAGLDQALNQQLAGAAPASSLVQMGVSFRARDGSYCRTFVLNQGHPVGGLACLRDADWHIKALAPIAPAAGSAEAYRLAASDMPGIVRSTAEQLIDGDPLDAAAEARARAAHWH